MSPGGDPCSRRTYADRTRHQQFEQRGLNLPTTEVNSNLTADDTDFGNREFITRMGPVDSRTFCITILVWGPPIKWHHDWKAQDISTVFQHGFHCLRWQVRQSCSYSTHGWSNPGLLLLLFLFHKSWQYLFQSTTTLDAIQFGNTPLIVHPIHCTIILYLAPHVRSLSTKSSNNMLVTSSLPDINSLSSGSNSS